MKNQTDSFLDLSNNKFFVDFERIQVLDPKNKRIVLISGHGWIKQSNYKKFVFKIYINRVKSNSGTISYLVRKSKNYNGISYIRCKDHLGIIWKFEGEITSIPLAFKDRTPEINGNTEEIWRKQKLQSLKDNSVILIFSDKYNFPHIKDEETITIDENVYQNISPSHTIDYKSKNVNIHGYTKDELIHIIIKKNRFSIFFYIRILESLKFITGQQLKPMAVIISKRGVVKTVYFSDYKYENVKLEAPIKIRNQPLKTYQNSWYLFDKFVKYVSDEYKGENYSSLGAEVNGQIGLGRSFFSSSMLFISVGIESLLNILYSNITKISIKDKKQINLLIDYIKEYPNQKKDNYINNELIEIAISKIREMKFVKAKNIFKKLMKMGVVSKKQVDTWEMLRHPSAHGNLKIDQDWDEMVEKFYILLEMYYRLIFFKIGYNGLYTVYGKYLFSIHEEKFEMYIKE